MPLTKRGNWEDWHMVIDSFKARKTEGFEKDIKALEAHILCLETVAPKDKAGWPVLRARGTLDDMRKDYKIIRSYLEYARVIKTASPDEQEAPLPK